MDDLIRAHMDSFDGYEDWCAEHGIRTQDDYCGYCGTLLGPDGTCPADAGGEPHSDEAVRCAFPGCGNAEEARLRPCDRGEECEDGDLFCPEHRVDSVGIVWCRPCEDSYDGPGDAYYERQLAGGVTRAERDEKHWDSRRLKR